MNNLKEIKQNIINHFKDYDIIDSYDDLIFVYKKHYTKFNIRLFFEKKNDDYIIKYENLYIKNLKKYRTLTKNNFYKKIENNISFIKKELDPVAESEKMRIENEKKYCSELKSYFIKKHDRVSISMTYNLNIRIHIDCYDYDKGKTLYTIFYINNKYYLDSKLVEHYNKIINN